MLNSLIKWVTGCDLSHFEDPGTATVPATLSEQKAVADPEHTITPEDAALFDIIMERLKAIQQGDLSEWTVATVYESCNYTSAYSHPSLPFTIKPRLSFLDANTNFVTLRAGEDCQDIHLNVGKKTREIDALCMDITSASILPIKNRIKQNEIELKQKLIKEWS